MSEFGLQQALVLVLTDARLTEAAIRGDLQSLTKAGVATEDAKQLLEIDRERFEIFAEMITVQRLTDLENMMPATTLLLGPRLSGLELAFRQQRPAQFAKRREYALALAEFLREEFQQHKPELPFLVDVMNYEAACLALFERRNETRSSSSAVLDNVRDWESHLHTRIFRSAANCTLFLDYDVLPAINQMKNTRTLVVPAARPATLLLRVNASGLIEHDQINAATSHFLELCDGKTLGEIVATLVTGYQLSDARAIEDFQEKCVALCSSLAARGIIELVTN